MTKCYAYSISVYLWPGVCYVQVVKSDVLDDLLLLVYVSFGQWHVLLSLQVKLCGKCVTAPLPLNNQSQHR